MRTQLEEHSRYGLDVFKRNCCGIFPTIHAGVTESDNACFVVVVVVPQANIDACT